MIDVREGVQENSRRHGYLLSFLGVEQVVVLVNKMDLVDWQEEAFSRVRDRFGEFLEGLGIRPVAYIPVSGREGDNLVSLSPRMPWYLGPTVKDVFLEFSLTDRNRGRAISHARSVRFQVLQNGI